MTVGGISAQAQPWKGTHADVQVTQTLRIAVEIRIPVMYRSIYVYCIESRLDQWVPSWVTERQHNNRVGNAIETTEMPVPC